MTEQRRFSHLAFLALLAITATATLFLIQPTWTPPAHAGQPFIAYDDFNTAALDSGRWRGQEFVREVRSGALFSRITQTTYTASNNLDFVNPSAVNSIEADVTVTYLQSLDQNRARARLTGFFYQTGIPGGPGDYTGVVEGYVDIRQGPGGPIVTWDIFRCDNSSCSTGTDLAYGVIRAVTVGQTVKLSVAYDEALNQFTFAADGISVTQVSPASRSGPPNVQWKAIGTRIGGSSTFTGIRSIAATFDNVKVNGILYDDFSSGVINPSKWTTREFVRELSGGKLVSAVTAYDSAQSNHLPFFNQNDVTGIKADVTVTQASGTGGNPRARLTGYFYKSSNAPVGDQTGEIQGGIDIRYTGGTLLAYWFVARCDDSACNVATDLQTGNFGNVNLGETHTLSIQWDGSIFTFGLDAVTQTFNPTIQAPVVTPLPTEVYKVIGTRVSPGVGASGSIRATFDNVQIQLNPATSAMAPALICGRIFAAESPTTGLANAGVVATAVSGGSGTFTTLTGPDGSYCIGVPYPSAQYTLSASEPGRQTSYYVGAGETGIDGYAATPFAVVSGGVTTRDMLLPLGASIAGQVTTGNGATPLAGAMVIFHRYNSNTFMPTDNIVTDVNGRYSFWGLPPGLYTTSARMTGYATGAYGGATDLGAAEWFPLAANESRTNVDMDLAVPAGTITGQITALGGGPIANATVYARGGYPRSSYVRSTATDASGNYTLPGLTPGRYLIEARAGGYVMRFYAAAIGQDVADPVQVTAGGTTSNINIPLPTSAGAISGTVRDETGDPVSTACIGAELITGGWTRSACANGNGTYTIDRLPAGLYRVRAMTEGAHIQQFSNGQLVSGAADDVAVTAGATTPNIDFTLKAHPGQIRGTVTRADNGQPIVGASINVRVASNSYIGGATSSTSGDFTVRSLPPGYYKVRVSHPDFALRYYTPTGGAEEMDAGTFVAVTADDDTADIDIALAPAFGRIAGKVTELDGVTPLVGAFIGVRHAVTGRTVAWDIAGTGGTYEVTGIPAGAYTVRASIRGRAVRQYNDKPTMETADLVVVNAGATTPNVNFALSPSVGSLSGRLTRTDGMTPIAEASVDAYDAATGGYVTGGTVKTTGDFLILDVPPGTYKVKAVHAPGFADRFYLAGQPGAAGIDAASVVVVSNGLNTPGVNIQLTQSAFVAGSVAYTGGQLGPVVVQLYDNNSFTGTPIYTTTLAGPVTFPAPFTFGSFTSPESEGVVPGTYYLRSFLDLNGNGSWDVNEPRGVLGGGTPGTVVVSAEGQTVNTGTVTIASLRPDAVGVFRPNDGTFYLDYNASGQWDGCGTDRCLQIGMSGDVPLVGDWNGSGTSKVGAFRPSDGTFYLDYNGNGAWDGCGTDRCLQIGMNGDIPLVGDWNGNGSSKVGAFRPADGTFYLDYNGSGTWDGCGTDRCLQIGMNGDIPLVGDWNGNGASKVGAFRPSDGTFYLDYNGSGAWEGCATDRCLQIGMLNDIPLVGDWNGSGTSKVGAFRPSDGTFYLDYNGSGTWEGCGTDRCLQIGMLNDTPLVGDWNGSGSTKVGVFRSSDGTFYLDYDGSGTWSGCGTDRCLQIGMSGDAPLVGKW